MTAQHRPAARRRRFRHDEYIAGDLFSGFGGLTQGIERAGFTAIVAANHNEYKVKVHEANHPHVEHWIADLVDPDSSDYHSVRELPPVDLLAAGVDGVNHSPANTKKAYERASRCSISRTRSTKRGSPAQSVTGPPPTASCTTPPSTTRC